MFYFTPLPGFFSPFPHGTGSLSVIQEYLVLRGGPRKFKRGSTCPSLLGIQFEAIKVFDYETFTLFGAVFQLLNLTFSLYLVLSLNPLKIEFRLLPRGKVKVRVGVRGEVNPRGVAGAKASLNRAFSR